MVTESMLAAPSHLQMFGCGFQECSFHHLPRDGGEVGQPIVPCVLLFEDEVTFAFLTLQEPSLTTISSYNDGMDVSHEALMDFRMSHLFFFV